MQRDRGPNLFDDDRSLLQYVVIYFQNIYYNHMPARPNSFSLCDSLNQILFNPAFLELTGSLWKAKTCTLSHICSWRKVGNSVKPRLLNLGNIFACSILNLIDLNWISMCMKLLTFYQEKPKTNQPFDCRLSIWDSAESLLAPTSHPNRQRHLFLSKKDEMHI